LKVEGNRIVRQIQQYKNLHGSYPDDLHVAGITLPEAPYGGWQ